MKPHPKPHRLAGFCLVAATLVLASPLALAQAWPAKPIRLIVPYAAGGPTDVIARLLAKKAGGSLGQTIVVDNKGGAGGTIGVDAALKSAPDGYTFALVAQGPLAGMPNLMKVPYAPTDIQYLSVVAHGPAVIVTGKDTGITSLAELIKRAKASPGKLNYGSAGPGTTPHIGAELLKLEADIDMTHVPYKGAAPAVTGLLGGEVQVAMVDLLPALPHISAGTLKILAVASPTRAPQLPEVPTTKELGLPTEVQKKFRDAVVAAMQSPELKEQLLKLGALVTTSTADEYRGQMQAEFDKWKRVVAKGKISLE